MVLILFSKPKFLVETLIAYEDKHIDLAHRERILLPADRHAEQTARDDNMIIVGKFIEIFKRSALYQIFAQKSRNILAKITFFPTNLDFRTASSPARGSSSKF